MSIAILPISIDSIIKKKVRNMTANLFNPVWALYDSLSESTILLDGTLTDWCAFNGINADDLIHDSIQGNLHLDRYQAYTTTIPGRMSSE